jgi:4-hydroxy-tetrahydrodipicolinate reductase
LTVRIGIAGINGRMGREVAALARQEPEITLVGGISRSPGASIARVVSDPTDLVGEIDVLIDFTSPEGALTQAAACGAAGVALVTGTTGLNERQMDVLRADASRIALFHAANMSPGVNAILAVLPALTRTLDGYDIEIVETHHRHKVDAPSGTALRIAGAILGESELIGERALFGRQGVSPRSLGEIGIHAVRGGGNPGEHTVILASDGEEVRLAHRAFNRAAYARGALRAARLIAGMPPGWYEPATLPGFL